LKTEDGSAGAVEAPHYAETWPNFNTKYGISYGVAKRAIINAVKNQTQMRWNEAVTTGTSAIRFGDSFKNR